MRSIVLAACMAGALLVATLVGWGTWQESQAQPWNVRSTQQEPADSYGSHQGGDGGRYEFDDLDRERRHTLSFGGSLQDPDPLIDLTEQ